MTVDVAELRRLLASATRRPWATCSEHPGAACSDDKLADAITWAITAVDALEPLLDELQALRGQVAEYRERLLARANEEPPSGWLRPGEDGYENTPEGARQARIRAERALEELPLREEPDVIVAKAENPEHELETAGRRCTSDSPERLTLPPSQR